MRHVVNGIVCSRSTVKDTGPPGEREVMALNPQRGELLKKAMGWGAVFPGSLNVKVLHADVLALDNIQALVFESHETVKYPEKYKGIPAKRGGYRYYKCRVKLNGNRVRCLARRAERPCKGVLELFADTSLRESLAVTDGATINLKITGTQRVIPSEYFHDVSGKWLRMEGRYQGAHAFLICGGPSFNKIDRRPLAQCVTMAVNNGARACMPRFRPTLWTCVDGPDKFLHTVWRDPKVLKLARDCHKDKWLWDSDAKKPARVQVKDCPNVAYWHLTNRFQAHTYLTEPGFCWGNNKDQVDDNGVAGRRSVMMCAVKHLYVLGFRHVYLLGCDFSMNPDGAQYSFDQKKHRGGCHGNNSSYEQLQWRFAQLQPHFLKAGFNVYNCNPDSNLTAFPMLDYENALHAALSFAGDDHRAYLAGKLEDTADLYDTKWYVCPDCKRHARYSKAECRGAKIKDRRGKHKRDADGKRMYETGTAACACGRKVSESDRKKYCKDKDQGAISSDQA